MLALAIVIAGCGSYSNVDVASAVNDVSVGMSEQDVRDALGDPIGTFKGSNAGVDWLEFRYYDLEDKDYSLLVSMSDGIVTDVKEQKRVDGRWSDSG